jgi:hypothetical protein
VITKQLRECRIGLDRDTIDSTPFLGVHHCHEWDYGYETTSGFNGPRRDFYADMREMMGFLVDYFNVNEMKEIVIAPCYRYNQFDERYHHSREMPGVDIFDEIRLFLREQGIKKGSRAGVNIPIHDNTSILEMILEGSFRGVSELCLFSSEQEVLIAPNHHFDLVFFTQKYDKTKLTTNYLLSMHPNLRYYDMDSKA